MKHSLEVHTLNKQLVAKQIMIVEELLLTLNLMDSTTMLLASLNLMPLIRFHIHQILHVPLSAKQI